MGNFFKNLLDGLSSAGSAVANVLAPDKALYQGLAAGASGLLSSMGIDQSNKQNVQLLDKQMDFQREMFDKQLAANKHSIIDQYNQYKQLGINPLSAQMSQSNMVGLPSSPSAQPINFMTPTERAQINLLDAQALKTRVEAGAIDPNEAPSRTALNYSTSAFADAQAETENLLREWKVRLNQAQYNDMLMSVYQKDALIENLNRNSDLLAKQVEYFDKDKFVEYMLADANVKKLSAEEYSIYKQLVYSFAELQQNIKESNSRIALNTESAQQIGLANQKERQFRSDGVWTAQAKGAKMEGYFKAVYNAVGALDYSIDYKILKKTPAGVLATMKLQNRAFGIFSPLINQVIHTDVAGPTH